MEVIKRVNHKLEKLYTADCQICGSTLRFSEEEGTITKNKHGTILVITCPVCDNKTACNLSYYLGLPAIEI